MSGIFQRRVRGFRVVEVAAFAIFVATALMVYLGKTTAGRENADIVRIEREIEAERERLRLLRADVAYLEQPERLSRLSSQYLGLQPITAKRETEPEALPEIARAGLLSGPASRQQVAQ